MRHSLFLMRPAKSSGKESRSENMFQTARLSQSLPRIQNQLRDNRKKKLYHFVGPTDFVKGKFFPQNNPKCNSDEAKNQTQRSKDLQAGKVTDRSRQLENQTTMGNFSKMANTTINRETILSKLSRDQQLQATKERRNLNRYKEYTQYWNQEANRRKKLLKKKRNSLLQSSQNVMVQLNPEKQDIINNHVVHYWQMSLRNHNPILKGHLKGHKYQQKQFQQLLQRQSGIKQIQNSIPRLPLERLKKISSKQISLSGRSKLSSQSQTMTERSLSYRQSFQNSTNYSQEQVYKINYDNNKKWMGIEGF